MQQGRVETDDGTRLLYQSFGEGPPIVFANGIGVRFPGALLQIEALRRDHQVICWDYRGMGQSVMLDPRTGDLSMERQALDILAILDQLELPRAVFVGWSMGVQVTLEVLRRYPERVAGFASMLGTYGKPFRTGLPFPLGHGVEQLFSRMGPRPWVAQALLDLAVIMPRPIFALLSLVRFVGSDADPAIFGAAVRSVAGVEKGLYLRTMLSLARHDATDVLPSVRCPVLVICGERDYVTPPKVARLMADRVPGAVYREIRGGTHFSLMEQAELINSWLLEFAEQIYLRGD